MKKSLTDKQRRVFEYIRERIVEHGTAPTIREIGEKFRISSTNGVRTHLTALIQKGYLKKSEFISRGLELVDSLSSQVGRLPVVGSVPAGVPIDAIENIDSEVALDLSLMPSGESFCLKVTGESMRNAGILDGDIVVVKKQATANKGEIVVALLNGEATVKRYMPEGKRVRLQPENDAFEPIMVDKRSGEFTLCGKVVSLIRNVV